MRRRLLVRRTKRLVHGMGCDIERRSVKHKSSTHSLGELNL